MLFISEGWGVGQGAREAGKETDWRLFKESRMKAKSSIFFFCTILGHPPAGAVRRRYKSDHRASIGTRSKSDHRASGRGRAIRGPTRRMH